MLKIALSTLRYRWASFVGSFVALALGVGLMATALLTIAATGGLPERSQYRFDAAPVLVLPDVSVRFTDGGGEQQVQPLAGQSGLPSSLVRAVARTGRTTLDRSFYAQLADGPRDQVGHGWSAAEFGGYRLSAGRPPLADGQIVVGGGDRASVGHRVRLMTATGPLEATVAGVTEQVPFEHAVFFTDAQAERLSPAVDALVAYGPAEQVRQAVAGQGEAKVLTDADRRQGDPNRDAALPGSPKAGQSVPVWRADGTATRLRVAAVFASAQDEVQGYLSADGQHPALASVAYVRLSAGADREAAAGALRTAVDGLGAQVSTPAQVADASRDANEQGSRTGLEMILGCSLLYAAVSLANTLAMTVAGRRRELALLRLAGATRGQVLRMLSAETLMCVAGGAALGTIASLVSATGAWAALRRVVGPMPLAVPWGTIAELGLLCTAVALAATVVPAALALRGGSADLAATRR
ncbi:ABC transporter permease [Kitasatospora sp. GP82]|uniref:ABC transporter permease n=1 Tax=Kitasatospora sp. GP82 TaxID=3035089 RepID=UPI0024754824|nr:ABC transporter permease [Kitasatospora sp. GP82]MDH6123992.1 hypothetical protein [Kitasatospora sp. GP82]